MQKIFYYYPPKGHFIRLALCIAVLILLYLKTGVSLLLAGVAILAAALLLCSVLYIFPVAFFKIDSERLMIKPGILAPGRKFFFSHVAAVRVEEKKHLLGYSKVLLIETKNRREASLHYTRLGIHQATIEKALASYAGAHS